MPSIWITNKSRPERSDAIQSFIRAADSATKRREAADFDRPAPAGPGKSPSGNRTDRANLRVRIVIHHLAKSLHPGSQAKQLEARRNIRQGLKLQGSRRNSSRCSKLVHGVAFLCGITTPSLSAQGEQ